MSNVKTNIAANPIIFVLLAFVALFHSSGVYAGTQLNHAPGFCNAANSSGTLVRHYQGTISNAHSTEELWLLCPLVRVSGQNTTGVVNVHVTDRSRDSGISCSFYNQSAYGRRWEWTGWTKTLGSGFENNKTFSFGPYTSYDKWDGFHHIFCKLPPKDAVYGSSELGNYSSGD